MHDDGAIRCGGRCWTAPEPPGTVGEAGEPRTAAVGLDACRGRQTERPAARDGRREDRIERPRGCACAGGTRAPCGGDGCSGTSACSRIGLSMVKIGQGPPGRAAAAPISPRGPSAGTAQPRAPSCRGHAAPVDSGDRINGTRWQAGSGQTGAGPASPTPGMTGAAASLFRLLRKPVDSGFPDRGRPDGSRVDAGHDTWKQAS